MLGLKLNYVSKRGYRRLKNYCLLATNSILHQYSLHEISRVFDHYFEFSRLVKNSVTLIANRHTGKAYHIEAWRNGRHFADDTFIFVNENVCVFIKISLKFVLKDLTDNKSAVTHLMACRQFVDSTLFGKLSFSE